MIGKEGVGRFDRGILVVADFMDKAYGEAFSVRVDFFNFNGKYKKEKYKGFTFVNHNPKADGIKRF